MKALQPYLHRRIGREQQNQEAARVKIHRPYPAQASTHASHHQSTSAVGWSEPGWNPWASRPARSPNAIRYMTQLPLNNPMPFSSMSGETKVGATSHTPHKARLRNAMRSRTQNPHTGLKTGLNHLGRGPGKPAHRSPARGRRRDVRARPT
jgi:hypothetical protein